MVTVIPQLPEDYLERVYAGILGKLIGVYLGRPIEGWTADRIRTELGSIEYYVNDRFGLPLVVTDDDLSGTFTFIRALEDHGVTSELSSHHIGETWLNYIIENRTILWWGGLGVSTEQTAWHNLRQGTPAPISGAMDTNGRTVAEQIGAQIFIDGWAMVAPRQPHLAAHFAEQAARVSHDGEAVHAAKLWCAMESAAFASTDIDYLLATGLSAIPTESLIAKMIADIRSWHRQHPNWSDTRQHIESVYGYEHYGGGCHVIPNHALMIMALLYAPHNFELGQSIVTSSGWDTDCNAGNLGCLHGIMLGLDGLAGKNDWRTPVADRLQISSADGGNSITDAVQQSYYLCNLGRRLANIDILPPPKHGARLHFSLPGSRQGFAVASPPGLNPEAIANVPFENSHALAITCQPVPNAQYMYLATPTFTPPDALTNSSYQLQACPTLYPGQTVTARVVADPQNPSAVHVGLQIQFYDANDQLRTRTTPLQAVAAGHDEALEWHLPEFGGCPIATVGLAVKSSARNGTGRIYLDYLTWDGAPDCIFTRPSGNGEFWWRAWVNGVDELTTDGPTSFRITQRETEGAILQGTRDWQDYTVSAEISRGTARHAGLIVRSQGARRFYACILSLEHRIQIVRRIGRQLSVLAHRPGASDLPQTVPMAVTVRGTEIFATVGNIELQARDDDSHALTCGGLGLLVDRGTMATDAVRVRPALNKATQ